MLEDGIYEIFGHRLPEGRSSCELRHCARNFTRRTSRSLPLGRTRGVLISQLLRLSVRRHAGGRSLQRCRDCVACERGTKRTHRRVLTSWTTTTEPVSSTDVTAHALSLTHALGEVPSGWMPRSAVRATQRLCDGRVILRDVIDLMVGATSAVASVALLDISTSPLGEGSERILRYHALVQTLRSSIVPLRSSIFSTATGELRTRDVDHEQLNRSVEEILGAVRDQRARP